MTDAIDIDRTAALPGDESTFVSNYLLYLLAAASHAASGQFHEEVRRHGLKVVEWRVLACLIERDGQMITRLARFALYEQSRLTRIIEKMEDRGLVQRRADHNDRRRVRVFLTPSGRQIAQALVSKARAHEATLLHATSEPDSAELKTALKTLIRHLGADVARSE